MPRVICQNCGQTDDLVPKRKYCTHGGDPDGKNEHRYIPFAESTQQMKDKTRRLVYDETRRDKNCLMQDHLAYKPVDLLKLAKMEIAVAEAELQLPDAKADSGVVNVVSAIAVLGDWLTARGRHPRLGCLPIKPKPPSQALYLDMFERRFQPTTQYHIGPGTAFWCAHPFFKDPADPAVLPKELFAQLTGPVSVFCEERRAVVYDTNAAALADLQNVLHVRLAAVLKRRPEA